MVKTPYHWNNAPGTLVAAIRTLALGETASPCACSSAPRALDLLPWPLLRVSTSGRAAGLRCHWRDEAYRLA